MIIRHRSYIDNSFFKCIIEMTNNIYECNIFISTKSDVFVIYIEIHDNEYQLFFIP